MGSLKQRGKRSGGERQHDGISIAVYGPNEDRGRDHLDIAEACLRQALLDPLLERLHPPVHDIPLAMTGARSSSRLRWRALRHGRHYQARETTVETSNLRI